MVRFYFISSNGDDVFIYSERGKKFWNTGCAVLSLILAFIFFDSAMFNVGENGSANSIFIQSISPMLSVNVEWLFLNTKR